MYCAIQVSMVCLLSSFFKMTKKKKRSVVREDYKNRTKSRQLKTTKTI